MIFKTFNSELDGLINKFGIFNKSIENIGRDYKSGNGLFISLFSGSNVTQKDIQAINAMNQAIQSGVPMARAWYDNMRGCTVAAKEQAKQCLINKGNLSELTTGLQTTTIAAKAGSVALKALSIAGNMIAMWAIFKVVSITAQKLDDFAHAAENAKEKAKTSKQDVDNLTSEINDLNKELETTKDKIGELLEKANSDTISLIEEEELELLKEQNEELEREIALKEKLAEIDAKEAAENAAYSLTYRTDDNKWDDEYNATDRIDKLQKYVDSANFYQDKLSEINQQILDIEESATDNSYKDDSVYKDLIKHQEEYQEGLKKVEEQMSSIYKELSVEDDGLYYNGKVIEGYEDLADRLDTVYMAVELYLDEGNVKDTTEDYIEIIKNKLIESGLSGEISNDVAEGFSEKELESIMNSGSIDWSQCLGLDDATAVIENIKEQLASVGNTNEIQISFDQAWADSFTSENDVVKELGNSLLELAEQGRLTIEAFNEADSTDYFKNLGISADEAVSKINKLVDESKQLSSMASQISSIVNALSTKLSDGFVSADTLSGFDIEVRGLDSWDRFQEVLGSTTSSYEECQEAANNLATEWVNSSDFLAQLTEQNKEYYETQLQAMGVENYEEVISYTQQLNTAKEALTQASFDVATATNEEIQAFINEGAYSELAQQQIWNLVLAKQTEEGITLDTSADCQNLLALAQNAGVTGTAIELLTQLLEIYNNLAAGTYGTNAQVINAVKNQANALKSQIDGIFANGVSSDTVELDPKIKVSPSTKSSAKSAGKETGDAYKDGLEEELSDLNSVISGITKAIDGQINSINDEKDAALDAIDAQIDALEEERDARLAVIDAQKKQLENDIKAIEKQIDAKQKEIDAINDAAKAREHEIALQKAQYELERMQNQRTILQYSEDKGMHYVQDTKNIRSAKDEVDSAKRQLDIDAIEKEIDLLEDKKDLLNEQIDLLDEQADAINEFYDAQIKALEKQKDATEKYFDSLIKALENSKSKYEELSEIVDKAELSEKFRKLGIDEEALLAGSEEEFQKLKDAYMGIVYQLNEGNDEFLSKLQELSGYNGTAPSMLSDSNDELDTMNSELDTANQSVGNVNSSLTDTASTTSEVATNVSDLSSNLDSVNGTIIEEQTAFDNLKKKIDEVIEAINLKTEAIQAEQEAVGIATSSEMADFLLLKEKILEVKETLESFGSQDEGLIHNIATAIESLNEIKLEDGIIGQFTQLKEAVDAVASAISSGGGESSGGESQGGNSGSSGSESGGKGSKGEGGGNSLTSAIEQMSETAQEVIGEPDAEGDGTVIGEFGSMENAVNDVTTAIGGVDSESGSSGDGESDNLIGSIVNLGETSDETLGESDGDGIIGKFNEFKGVIEEAANQVKSISDGLDEIDGKEVECTITVNVKMNGSIPAFASGTVLGNMQIESATYNAQYGKAFASGTIGLPHAEKNALVSEYGQTEMTVLPDGKTIITDTPTLMDLPKDTVIYNEEETKKIMDNKINVSGNAHADGTTIQSEPVPYDPDKDDSYFATFYKAWNAYYDNIDKNVDEINKTLSQHIVIEHSQKMNDEVNRLVNNSSVVNKNQPNINVGGIHVTCPGVTSQEVAKQVGTELNNMFSGLHLEAMQQSMMR